MDYIKLSRKILEWEWYSDIKTCRLFLHMLLKANWKDGRFQGMEVPRGSFISSLQNLSTETSLSVREVRTALEHLESTGEVTHKGHAKHSVFTVKNYALYQTRDIQTDKQPTSQRHSTDMQATTIEEKEEGKNKRIKDNMSSGTSSDRSSMDKSGGNDNQEYPYKQVVDYLNQKAGTSFRATSKDTRQHIRARFEDNYTLEDFYKVIDKKVAEWGHSPRDGEKDMRGFLRPVTLFGKKFGDYLGQMEVSKPRSQNKFNNFQQRNYDFDELEGKLLDC